MSTDQRSKAAKPPSVFDLMAAGRRYRAGGPGPKCTLHAVIERMGEYDGEWRCWPKMEVLAFETEQSLATVRRHVAAFEEAGLLHRRTRGREGGGRNSNDLVLNVTLLLGITSDTKPPIVSGLGGANRSSEGNQTAHPSPFLRPVPLLEVPEEVPARAPRPNRSSALPVDFPITAEMERWANDKFGIAAYNLPAETEHFLDYHRARGTVMKDWTAAWRTWITKAVAFELRNRPARRNTGMEAAEEYRRHIRERGLA